jgi:segregation and condensation protein B
MDNGFLHSVVEALIIASPEPIPAQRIAQILEGATPAKVEHAVADLNERYRTSGASFRIREVAGGFQLHILPDFIGYIEELFTRQRKVRLSRAALETLAIVAYRQPVTKTDIEHIRGVAADGVLQNLLEKNLITITGRAATVGRPLQYGTTDEFLKFFGLAGLDALPKMAEIEELLAAAQPKPQTELPLPTPPPEETGEAKLNIADGTFDPQRAAALDEAQGVFTGEADDVTIPRRAVSVQLTPSAEETPDADSADDLGSSVVEEAHAVPEMDQ